MTHACPAQNADSGVKFSKMEIFSHMDNQITCQLPHISHRAWELRHAISSNMAEWTLEILVVLWNDTLNMLHRIPWLSLSPHRRGTCCYRLIGPFLKEPIAHGCVLTRREPGVDFRSFDLLWHDKGQVYEPVVSLLPSRNHWPRTTKIFPLTLRTRSPLRKVNRQPQAIHAHSM